MVGFQNIGCNTATPIFFVSPFDSLANSAFREFIAVCVFNNTDTVQGGPVAFLAKANVSSVNWQYNATASISYRVLYNVALQSFFPDLHWSVVSGDSSRSSVLRNLWYLSEPVAAATSTHYSEFMPAMSAALLLLECDKFSKLDSTALVCDASSVTEGQKSIVVTPLSPSFVGLEQVRLSVRVLPVLSILSSTIPALGNPRFLFKITGLDPTFAYQLICTFRSSVTSTLYSNTVDSVIVSPSLFACAAPAIDAAGASWTFRVSSALANFALDAPSQVSVLDLPRVIATNIDPSVGSSVPVSMLFSRKESMCCKLSAPLTASTRSLELVGGAYATVPSPSFAGLEQYGISLWIKASPASKDDMWSNLVSSKTEANGFSVSIKHINQASAPGTLAVIKFCAYVLIDSVSSEKCVSSNSSGSATLPLSNVWTHIVAGVNSTFGDVLLVVNGQYFTLKDVPFTINLNPTRSVVVLGHRTAGTPYDGLIDNVRLFSVFPTPDFVTDLYQGTFSSYPLANLMMSLTFDDDDGRDEVSGNTITSNYPAGYSVKGQWFATCNSADLTDPFTYSVRYNESHFLLQTSETEEPSWIR